MSHPCHAHPICEVYAHLDAKQRAVISMTRLLVLLHNWSHYQARAFALAACR